MATSDRVLALKYRPQTFDEVVGQRTVTTTLKNAIASGRIGHAFLLSGARGVGKTTTARILAKALNCAKASGPTPDPCGECESCLEIAQGKAIDVQEIDGATNNSVDDVRELRESARYNPARDRFKIWIIDEVHMLSAGAFNALLKTLEEPPPRVKFIFATTEYHKLPDTILSRCQQYDFRLIPARDLAAHLREVAQREGIAVSEKALEALARAAEGSVRDGLSLFDQVLSFSPTGREVRDEDLPALLGLVDRELLARGARAIVEQDCVGLLELVEELSEYGADYRRFARELLLYVRELLIVKLAPAGSRLLDPILPEERERLGGLAAALSDEDLLRFIDVLDDAGRRLADRTTDDPRVTLELALLKLAQLRRLIPFAELVARVEALGAGAAAPAPPRPPAPRPVPAPAASRLAPMAPTPARPASAPDPAPPRPASADAVPAPAAVESAAPDEAGRLLAEMRSAARPSQVAALRAATARFDGPALVLEVASDFFAFAQMHADEYEQLAGKAAGRPVKVQVAASASVAPAPPPAEDVKRERLMREAQREPAVQEALDLFGGKVVGVRESERD
jgi:DNA polymerase-3 subunit gamma/tau